MTNLNIFRSFYMTACALLILLASFLHSASVHAAKKKEKPVVFMEAVAKKLLAAAKSGSKKQMQRVIASYADMSGIGTYSLGDYAKKLPNSRRRVYQRGVAKFMARYLIGQSKQYKIAKAEILGLGGIRKNSYLVDSKVILEDGTEYDVQWRIKKHKRTFKIRDAKVLGFWLVPFQRDLFNNFVSEQGGNVNALVLALNY
ncbi:MAG: ABC transporter substrate-binding protein [Pseudomonadota bacterium]